MIQSTSKNLLYPVPIQIMSDNHNHDHTWRSYNGRKNRQEIARADMNFIVRRAKNDFNILSITYLCRPDTLNPVVEL